jgi:hypothetical protein
MKNLLFILGILFSQFSWSQSANYSINSPGNVEVGINSDFGFGFKPVTNLPPTGEGELAISGYRITSWFINANDSNMNNSGQTYYNSSSTSLTTYGISQSQSLNFPIKWSDNSNVTSYTVNITTNVTFYRGSNASQTFSYSHNISVNVNRIFTPTIT